MALCGRFLAERTNRLRRRSLISYEAQMRIRIVPWFGRFLASEVTYPLALEAHAAWCDQYGPAAGNNSKRLALSVWADALRTRTIGGENPWHGIPNRPEVKKRNPVQPDQALALRERCEAIVFGRTVGPVTREHALAYLVGLSTGMRVSNCVRLQWPEVDLEVGELRIPRHKGRRRDFLRIALNQYACWLLGAVPRWDAQWVCPSPKSASGHIVEHWRPLQRLLAELDVGQFSFHDFRRGFAQSAWDAGRTDKDVQLLLGHASVTTTQNFYLGFSRCRVGTASNAAAVQLGLAVGE